MAEQSLERARALIELGRSDEARVMLGRILALEPEDAEALLALSLAEADDEPRSSLETARRVLALEPENLQALLLCVDACHELNRVKEAEHYARLAVSEAPWLGAAHAGLAQALGRRRGRGRYKEAKETAQRAIELDPQGAFGYVAAGNVEMAHGEWKEAERWYRKALDVDPSDRNAQINLVTAQESRGRISPALTEAVALLQTDPHDKYALEVLHETVYTTVVHLLWIAAVFLIVAAVIRGE